MTDRNRSLVPHQQQRRDVAPARPSRSIVPAPQHAPDISRTRPPARETRNAVIPAPDLNWRTVPREEPRMVPASRRDVEVRPQHVEHRYHQEPAPYVEEYDYSPAEYDDDRPVRVRRRVSDDGRSVNVHIHVHNENRNDAPAPQVAARSSDLEGLWVGGSVVAFAAFVALILSIVAHH